MVTCKMDLDDLFPVVGQFGRYQKLLIWLICIPVCIMSGLQSFKQVIMAAIPLHWCRPPLVLQDANVSYDLKRHLSIPPVHSLFTTQPFSPCHMYDVNYTEVLSNLRATNVILTVSKSNEFAILNNSYWPTTKCLNGWEYDTEYFDKTVVSEWDLVCDKDIIPPSAQCAMNLGGMFGVVLFGYVADRWGRKISFFVCLGVSVVTEVLTAFSPGYIFWIIIRFLAGLTLPAMYQVVFILTIELVGPSHRVFVSVMAYVFYSVGLVVFAGFAYFIRSWDMLALATSVPFILFFITWKFLPESPRWLMIQGRTDEVLSVFDNLAKINGTTFPESCRAQVKECSQSTINSVQDSRSRKSNASLYKLFQTPKMRRKTLLLTFCWFSNMTVYAGLSLYAPALGTNPYLSLMLGAVVELPAHAIMVWVMEIWSRRWSLCTLMLIGGLGCVLTVIVQAGHQQTELGLYLIGKFSISATYLIIYAYGSELFPTEVRGMGLGFAANAGMLGSALIPYVNYVGTENRRLPLFICGILVMLGGLSALGLQETLHQKLPQTIEEVEQIKKMTRKEFFLCCMRKKAIKDEVQA